MRDLKYALIFKIVLKVLNLNKEPNSPRNKHENDTEC